MKLNARAVLVSGVALEPGICHSDREQSERKDLLAASAAATSRGRQQVLRYAQNDKSTGLSRKQLALIVIVTADAAKVSGISAVIWLTVVKISSGGAVVVVRQIGAV